MKKIALFFIATIVLADENLLSYLKKQELSLDKQTAIIEAKKFRDSWINPINMSYLYQTGNQFPNQELKNFTISVNQPIFKSGGIWAAIKYANAKKIASLYGVRAKRKNLIALVIELGFRYKKLLLQIKKQKLLIKNASIDVEVKKDNYLHGLIDSTFLNSAIINKNRAKLALLELKSQKTKLLQNLQDVSDIDIDAYELPRFSLIDKKSYLQDNILVKKSQEESKAAKIYKFMNIARYLPTISFVANYNHQVMHGSLYVPGYSYKDSYYTYGLRVSMPLFDINSFKVIQEAKIEYLKSQNSYFQTKREKIDVYRSIIQQLKIVDEKIALAKEDKKLYEDLLKQTKALFRAGEKTLYDVQTLQNSVYIKELELKMYDFDKQLLLLQLYKEMDDAI